MENFTDANVNYLVEKERCEMITNVSEVLFHDFKNTLAIISGLSQLSMLITESDKVKANLLCIKEASFELRNSIDSFYNFTKGHSEEPPRAYILNSIVDDALGMLKFKIENLNSMNHKVNLNLIINSSDKVFCNEYELKQAFLNLFMNAIDSMEENGGTLSIEIYNNENMINIDIIDTGVGISKDNLDRLFKETFTTKRKGTGLGLKIAKNTMEKFNGSLRLDSELGKGTKVSISLPIYYSDIKELNE